MKNITFEKTPDHIIVYEKEKQLFKVSNNADNERALHEMCRKEETTC